MINITERNGLLRYEPKLFYSLIYSFSNAKERERKRDLALEGSRQNKEEGKPTEDTRKVISASESNWETGECE